MAFDVFEKLSELETKVYMLENELKEKDAIIETLTLRNTQLQQELESQRNSNIVSAKTGDCCSEFFESESGKSVAETLKETSEAVVRGTGYAFDEHTGLYFDHSSGYYYDPENRLFFEPRTGTYYGYNAETGEYTFHSSLDSSQLSKLQAFLLPNFEPDAFAAEIDSNPTERRKQSRACMLRSRQSCMEHCNSKLHIVDNAAEKVMNVTEQTTVLSNEVDHSNESEIPIPIESSQGDFPVSLIAKPIVYPPGLRFVVLSSKFALPGSVFILTSDESSRGWGCIGRNPTFCPSVNFPDDPDIAIIHCEVIYNESAESYSLLDRESSSGTFLNGLALPKNEPVPLSHGDVLRLGGTRLLVHIHRGSEVCGQCIPENLTSNTSMLTKSDGTSPNDVNLLEPTCLSAAARRDVYRRVTLDLLKEKYGIRYLNADRCSEPSHSYNDRAAQRRALQVNSNACRYADDAQINYPEQESSQSASRNECSSSLLAPIGAENRGAQMLTKMGWKQGEGLGKFHSGIIEPIPLTVRTNSHAGLGSDESKLTCATLQRSIHVADQKMRIQMVTRERYNQLQ